MANNMQSFDFDTLDPVARDETLSFLNSYDPTLLPDPSYDVFEGFGDPMTDWMSAENHMWDPAGYADLSAGVMNALTDIPNPGPGFERQPHQPHHDALIPHLVSANQGE
jgi:hypothetical protein